MSARMGNPANPAHGLAARPAGAGVSESAPILECLTAIMADFGVEDLGALQRAVGDSRAAGMHVDFQLHDGAFVYAGDARVSDPAFSRLVRKLGIGSRVEGSDVELPVQWIDLEEFATADDEDYAAQAAGAVRALFSDIEEDAISLWNEPSAYEGDSE
jgi:hypothetical protein